MVTISKAISPAQAQSYHKLEYTSAAQSYYKQDDTVQGEWQGQLAASFGLAGTVMPQEFARLTEGKHPQTEAQMVKHREGKEYTDENGNTVKPAEHRAGWDATFSAPKSVSLTALVGGDERVREAHRAAVTTALDELEKYTYARIGGNAAAEQTGKLIAAKFEHDTARPVAGYAAPQLHTHAVIFNVTEREDGSTRALQPQALFDSQNYATAVYQSALTLQLRKLGYELEPGQSGAPEIKGYTQAYLDASSPRSQQIKEQLERAGFQGPEAAEIAAHATRDRKQTLTAAEVLAAHKERAAEFGNQPEQVVQAARERALSQSQTQPGIHTDARAAVAFAREKAFEREAVVDERLILRDALRRGVGEVSLAEVQSEFQRRREAGEFRSVDGRKHDSGARFTTPETIAAEHANVRHVHDGQNAVTPILAKEEAERQAQSRGFLNDAQRTAIREVLTSPDRVHGLQGLAGTGKTTSQVCDPNTGLVSSITDANNATTTYTYDAMLRETAVLLTSGNKTYASTSYCFIGDSCYSGSQSGQTVTKTVTAAPDPNQVTTTTLDGFGRPVSIAEPNGAMVASTYDARGRLQSVTNPYNSTNDSTYGITSYLYDALGRKTYECEPDNSSSPSTTCTPNNSFEEWTISGGSTTYQDENGHQWQRTTDALGRLVKVLEPDPSTGIDNIETDYMYDPLNNMIQVDQWGSYNPSNGADTATCLSPSGSAASGTSCDRQRQFVYDDLSRLTLAGNPESNATNYMYDSNNNLHTRTDGNGVVTTYSYDALNRLTGKSYSDGTPTVSYYYDTANQGWNFIDQTSPAWSGVQQTNVAGRLSYETVANSTIVYGYDPAGRTTLKSECTPATCGADHGSDHFDLHAIYDLAGNPTFLDRGLDAVRNAAHPNSGYYYGPTPLPARSTPPSLLLSMRRFRSMTIVSGG